MDEKAKKKRRKDVEVMNSNVADDKEVQFLDDNQESKMKKRKKYDSSLNGVQELGFSKPSKKMRKDNGLKNNEGDDDDQVKQMMKEKKSGEESQREDHNEFKSKENKDDGQYKKKKRKLSEESKNKEYNEFESNEGGDDDHGKKMKKKKKLCDKGKSKENRDFNSKQMKKKKKSGEESQHEDYNEFKSNEDKDDGQYKKEEKKRKKKKKLSEEFKSKEYNEFESNEGEDDGQGKNIKKKKLRDKSKNKENSELNSNDGDPPSARVKSRDGNAQCIVTEVDDQSKKMKTKKAKADTDESPNPAHSGSSKPKRVTFSDQVDVCCDGLVRGRRFTPEEDEKIKLAVFDYIESHGLGDEGLDMVLHCKSHPEIRDCWKEIGAALPERPNVSVYSRAHILFERGEKRRWTPEELEFLRKVQEQHGSDWKSVAEALGKHRFHVKDTWRRIKLTNTNKGRWTQDEYQNLFDLVNLDLRVRASQGYKKSKHGMLRDNIGWEAIGDKLSTRSSALCCQKWYDQLTSPMVANGVWSDTDDYGLVNALFTLDACCMEEVDWDNLLEHRPGDVCRKRWNQMVQYIGEHGGKSFAEQVEILAKRFCPDLLEVREALDEKPVVC
ncbi:Cyclin-D-binding Myb transcription factor 1 [Spatholobus suberectus]|nr:Cyclin-D-binding Myb transcription factor 1 [Spatholobus suberectus]